MAQDNKIQRTAHTWWTIIDRIICEVWPISTWRIFLRFDKFGLLLLLSVPGQENEAFCVAAFHKETNYWWPAGRPASADNIVYKF